MKIFSAFACLQRNRKKIGILENSQENKEKKTIYTIGKHLYKSHLVSQRKETLTIMNFRKYNKLSVGTAEKNIFNRILTNKI